MSKRREAEIAMISDQPGRRPYAAKVGILLEEGIEYRFGGEACLLIDGDFIIRVRPEKESPREDGGRLQRLTAIVEGFATACEAERMGLKLSLALLWFAVSRKHHLKLEYHTPQPCVVFDRTQKRAGGLTMSARLTVTSDPSRLCVALNKVFEKQQEADPRVLISMELFASSMLELTERARFITLVSSLEPLASQESYENKDLEKAISQFAEQLSLLDLPKNTRESVMGRAKALSCESVSQSILRLVQKYIPDNHKAIESVKAAYEVRSKLLHEGTFDADLHDKAGQLEDIIRHLYSRILQLDLEVPAQIGT